MLSSLPSQTCRVGPSLLIFTWRRRWQPTPVFLPGKSHGRTSLVGYSPWGCKESNTTERLHFTHFMLYHWRRKWQPTPVFLPGESHGHRSLAGHGPWSPRGLDRTEVTKHARTYLYQCPSPFPQPRASFFFLLAMPCGILDSHPGIEVVPPALEAQSLDRWTAREGPHKRV